MHTIRCQSASPSVRTLQRFIRTAERARTVGILKPKTGSFAHTVVTLEDMVKLAAAVARVGIARAETALLLHPERFSEDEINKIIDQIDFVLVDTPIPKHEWPILRDILGHELLARLTDISPASLNRYASNARKTPDKIAARLHFLALVVGDLRGSYNDIGIRLWFGRPRRDLNGKTPTQALGRNWKPEDPGPIRVAAMAHVLVNMGAV